MIQHISLFCVVCLGLASSAFAEMREWTNAEGRRIQAEFLALEAGVVKMKLPGGKRAAVPYAQLSEADQAWVKNRVENPPAPKPQPPPVTAGSSPKEIDWGPLKDAGTHVPNFEPLPEPRPDTLIPVNDRNAGRRFYMRPDGSDAFPHLTIRNQVERFSDGLAYVKTQDHEGYINREGKWVLGGDGGKPLPEGGEYYQPFSEGRARFNLKNRFAYIDVDGKVISEVGVYTIAHEFRDGLALVYDGRQGADVPGWHYIDRDGNKAIAGPFFMARDFSSGVAWVALDQQKMLNAMEGRKRLINTKGEPVFGEAVIEGVVSHRFMGGYGKIGGRVYHSDGSVYLEEQEDYFVFQFSDSDPIAFVNCGGHARLLHLPSGAVYGPKLPSADVVGFQGGVAAVKVRDAHPENHWFCLDRTGRLVSKEGFTQAPRFHEGFAVTTKAFGNDFSDERTVVINRKGEIIYKGEPRK